MRILSIGTDRKLFDEESATRTRHRIYAQKFDALDIVVFTRGNEKSVHSDALSIIPTNSISKLFYGIDALLCARKLPKPDVVTVQDPFETGLIGLIIARTFGVPLHVQVHTDFTSREFARSSFVNRLRARCAWFVLRRAARMRVILERTKEHLRAHGITRPITVLPIFVDISRFSNLQRLKHPRFKIALLAVGRLEPEKRLYMAIDALRAARGAGHDAGLTVVGSGKEEASLRTYARVRGLEHFVDFVGWQHDVTPYLSAADILLVPSRYEGYGLVIIEALAAGVPVLSTDVGVAREAGAMVTTSAAFAEELVKWIQGGPRRGELHAYPYESFDEYVRAYCNDLVATTAPVLA